jgi:hypothetical protein
VIGRTRPSSIATRARRDLPERLLPDHGEHGQREPVSDARGQGDGVLGRPGQRPQLPRHQVDDVVRDLGALDAGEVDAPGAGGMVELEEAVGVQRFQELGGEERVPSGLAEHKLGEGIGVAVVASQGVPDEEPRVVTPEVREDDLHRALASASRPGPSSAGGRATKVAVVLIRRGCGRCGSMRRPRRLASRPCRSSRKTTSGCSGARAPRKFSSA